MTDPSTPTTDEQKSRLRAVALDVAENIRGWSIALGIAVVVASGLFAAGATTSGGQFFVVAATAVGLGAAGGLLGGFTGLLFGMPREAEATGEQGAARASRARYSFNSNLLRVSDWVTTIIVGLSLVSLRSVPSGLRSFADWVGPALGGTPSSGAFGVFLPGAAFVAMFMLLYIWSIIPLRGALEDESIFTERQWADLSENVARGDDDAASATLRTLSLAQLEAIAAADEQRVAPRLRTLAEEEGRRRTASGG